jgi:ribosome-binding factor A
VTKRARSRQHPTARDYPRTARLNQLFQEILADELERVDDDRLDLVTIMSVSCDSDLRHATVYYDTLEGEDDDEEVLAALADHRWALQGAIGRQTRVKRTPELIFEPDAVGRGAARIEEVIRGLHQDEE